MQRPDLNDVDPAVVTYIEYLEKELGRKATSEKNTLDIVDSSPVSEPTEPPTPYNLITLSANGIGKRTPRHLYTRQHRAGMGILDLDTPPSDPPTILTIAEENQTLILFTNHARAFRFPLNKLEASEIHARGVNFLDRIPLEPDEHLVAALPDQATGFIALVSEKGMVRSLRHHLFGEYLRPGTSFFNDRDFGPLAAASWTTGDADLLIASRHGMSIRFSEKLVTPQGILGIRLNPTDQVTGITSVHEDSRVFFLGADGKGTIRPMSSFAPNKSAGGSGKIALKTDCLVGCTTVTPADDLFIISSLSKIIRFRAAEVPESEGAIQGVHCINLRADTVTAFVKSSPQTLLTFQQS